MVNVGKYTIHGWYGIGHCVFPFLQFYNQLSTLQKGLRLFFRVICENLQGNSKNIPRAPIELGIVDEQFTLV